jgi:AraC-like DNA-binding protein
MLLRRRDPVLRSLLERQADEIIAGIPPLDGQAFAVRRVLARRVAGGDATIASVAREQATTPRTLQRRLAAEGLSFQGLLEQVRREAVER